MNARVLYAHRSLFGSDGYGFIGTSEPVPEPVLSRIESMITRLGFDSRSVSDSPALFCLRIEPSVRILGEVSVIKAKGKSTLRYKLIVLQDGRNRFGGADPLAAIPLLAHEACWVPGIDGRIPSEPEALPAVGVSNRASTPLGSVQVPYGVIRGIAREALCNWLDGISPESRRRATFLVAEKFDLGTLGEFLDGVNFTSLKGSGDSKITDPSGNDSAKSARSRLAIGVIVGLLLGFFLGIRISSPRQVVSCTDAPELVAIPTSPKPPLPIGAPPEAAAGASLQSELAVLHDKTLNFVKTMEDLDALLAARKKTASGGVIELPYQKEADDVRHYLDRAGNDELPYAPRLEALSHAMSVLNKLARIPRDYELYYRGLEEQLGKASTTAEQIRRDTARISQSLPEDRDDHLNALAERLENLIAELADTLKSLRQFPPPEELAPETADPSAPRSTK